jgi:hypothetical protein
MGQSVWYTSRTWSNSASSSAVSVPTPDTPPLAMFSSTCSIALMPLRTMDTSG